MYATQRSGSVKAAIRKFMQRDWSLLFGQIAMWLSIVVFGGLIWVINGGYSVIGLRVTASSFNEAGSLFWAAISAITFAMPVHVPGLPDTQPIFPWIGVIAASMMQIVVMFRKSRQMFLPNWMLAWAAGLSLYDLGTTFQGLGTVLWIARGGVLVQVVLASILTFLFEVVISLMLKQWWPRGSGHTIGGGGGSSSAGRIP